MKKKCEKPTRLKCAWLQKLVKIMKLTFFLILVSTMLVSAGVYSQNTKLSLHYEEISIGDLLELIEEQTEFRFAFSKSSLNRDEKVSINVKKEKLDKVLSIILDPNQLSYRIIDKYVVISDKSAPGENRGFQPQITVSGKATDSSGSPLPGVTVVVKGTTQGTVTNAFGEYSISNIPDDAVLVFSFVGMRAQEIVVGSQTTINVEMEEEAIGLEEVVAVGYGTQKKANLTGSVGVANSERLENRTITSLGQGLQGVIPGLNVTFTSGDPNEAADFNIRGFESINGGEPLILVDGVPMDVEKINPNDIKSISVLKDASSAAIYGARAAFGVILVETKKGQIGKTNINFSAQMTMQKAIFPGYEPVTEGGTARKIMDDALQVTRGITLLPKPVIDAAIAYQEMDNPTEDDAWMYYEGYLYPLENTLMKDLAFRDFAPQQQYDFSINGASEKASYYVSLGVINKDGFFRYGNESYKRYNVLSKVDFHVNDWLTLEEKISFSSVLNNNPHAYHAQWHYQSIGKIFYTPHAFPDLTYYVEPGDRDKWAHLIGMQLDNRNPIPFLKNGGRDTSTENDIWLSQGVTITPLKGLKIKGDFSYRYYWQDSEMVRSQVDVLKGFNGFEMTDDIIFKGRSTNDFIDNRFDKNTYYVFNTFAEYAKEDLGDHKLKALVGFNEEYGKTHSVSTRSTKLISPFTHSLTATTGVKTNSDSKNEIKLRGLFYRLNYSYKDKYLFEANGRYDGTSRFPKESRYGFFPSFSLGWRVSEESFLETTKNWLDNLKIRASYGQLGNQNVGAYYPYISTMASGTSVFLLDGGGTLTNRISPGGLISNSLTWETVVSKNIGVDFTMLGGKLDVVFDYFIRDTKDMLMKKVYPGTLGAAAPSENAADLRNTGWELAATWRNKVSNDLSYQVNLSLSDYQTEITKYENTTGAIFDYYVGKKVGEIWGFETVGLFQTESELANAADQSRLGSNWRLGDVHYSDLDGDGAITVGSNTLSDTGDRVRIGNSTPRYSFGINPSIKYKNFTLNVFAQGVLKRDWYPSRGNYLRFWPFKTMAMEQWWIDDSWSPENSDAYFPGKQFAYSDNKNTYEQTRYLQNAAYIRLKNVTLSYDIPVKFVANAQVYLNGANLWEATGMYKTLDPEYSTDLKPRYMFHRSFTLGLKVTL
ncbi:TonB-dependent receptor [Mariniphaga sediminis]|uniref:TonB-dependent receptor n=1 Tax=Mariniphaga sediminis TaxID=1628158 RepID=UPI003562D2F0